MNSETRGIFKNTSKVFENGNSILQQHKDEKAQSTKGKLQEEEQELKEVERKRNEKIRGADCKGKVSYRESFVDGTKKNHVRNKGKRAGNVEKG